MVVSPALVTFTFEPDTILFVSLSSDSDSELESNSPSNPEDDGEDSDARGLTLDLAPTFGLAGLGGSKGIALVRLLLSSGRELASDSGFEGEPDSEPVSSEVDPESSEASLDV